MKRFKTQVLVTAVVLCSGGKTEANWATLDFPGARTTTPLHVEGGKIVGVYQDTSYVDHGFLYDGSTWTALDVPGADWTRASGIDGDNIFGSFSSSDEVYVWERGFVYDGTSYRRLHFPGAKRTRVSAVGAGIIAGTYDDTSGHEHGFVYDGTSWLTLDYRPTTINVVPLGIEGDRIVGSLYNPPADWIPWYWEGFIRDGNSWKTLEFPEADGTWPNGTWIEAIAGETIVGYYRDSSEDFHGFIHEGDTWTLLDFPGATDTFPADINGDKIVGWYLGLHNNVYGEHGFIYTIPEPGTVLLLGLGGIGLLRRRGVKKSHGPEFSACAK